MCIAIINGYRQQIEKYTYFGALRPVRMEVGLAPECLAYLQRAYLGLCLVLLVGPLFVGVLAENIILFHDNIAL